MKVVIVGEAYFPDPQIGGGPVYPERPVDPGWGHTPGHPGNRPPGSWGGPVDPGFGQRPPVDPGYGRPGWSPVDPGWGGGPPVYPSHGLPNAPVRPDNSLPPGVEVWPQPPEAGTKPVEPGAGTSPENPIVVPAPPPEGTVILVWVSGVGYRYVTIGEAEPK